MKKFLPTAVLAAVLLLVALLCACSTELAGVEPHPVAEIQTPETKAKTPEPEVKTIDTAVRVIATRDFGRELMFDERLDLPPGSSAMAALQKVAEVETDYGGGFVDAIDGVRSGFTGSEKTKRDWFIYINGIQSNVGALDYQLLPGDVEHWDYHDWSFQQSIPAVIGAFPEPFRHGFDGRKRPTVVVYSANLLKEAEELQDGLVALGVSDVSITGAGGLAVSEKEASNLVLLGTADNELILELNRNWKKLGLFAYFEGGNLVVLDARGEIASTYSTAAGLIQATQNPWNPKGTGACENVVWTVTGTDEEGVKAAIDAVLNYPAQLQYAFAAVIASGEIIRIPR
jgi:hypothetical protein